MIYAFDVYYPEEVKCTVACLAFEQWTDQKHVSLNSLNINVEPQPYISGEFYKRELPPILNIIEILPLKKNDILLIDGFVVLDDEGRLGLGGHLFHHFDSQYPVIGVAKHNFATLEKEKVEIVRGQSNKPLFITTLGIEKQKAAEHILSMHGNFRIPTLLKILDQKTKLNTNITR